MNTSIIACNKSLDIGTAVVLWDEEGGFRCPHRRGRIGCTQHDPTLNDQPTRPDRAYRIFDTDTAYSELKQAVYQFILHYDVCYTSSHCHQLMHDSTYKGSHFYLDLDGTIYQTCDLYWKTNTAPADDRLGNERAVHVELSNLSWEARREESELFHFDRDQYRKKNGRWELVLPPEHRSNLRTPRFTARPSRSHASRGYFSRRINGKVVRMWDFTEEQYRALIALCLGLNKLLPNIQLKVPYNSKTRRTPLDRLKNYSTFRGVLGHAHVQGGTASGLTQKYDPGSAFNWSRLRRAFLRELASKKAKSLD